MNDQPTVIPNQPGDDEREQSASVPSVHEASERAASRRRFLGASARKIAYVAPVVLLFRPRQACAASGTSGTS